MSRIGKSFERLAREGRKALVTYVVAGDPSRELTVPLMHEMVANGVTAIELGMPFTDPEAEGPVIQLAQQRALDNHIRMADVLGIVEEFRRDDDETPIILMGYLNPVEHMGYDNFARAAASAGIDGTIIVNLPPEEGEFLDQALIEHGIDPVYLLAPTTTESRARMILGRARGFAYYVSLKGTTGASTLNVDDVRERLDMIKPMSSLPIAVGFGIKNGESARRVADGGADGVVIGAAVVSLVEAGLGNPADIPASVGAFVKEIRDALDA